MASAKVVWNGRKLWGVVILRLADARSPLSHGTLNPDSHVQANLDSIGISIPMESGLLDPSSKVDYIWIPQ